MTFGLEVSIHKGWGGSPEGVRWQNGKKKREEKGRRSKNFGGRRKSKNKKKDVFAQMQTLFRLIVKY